MIREPRPEDIDAVFGLICELADFEKLSHQIDGTAEDLRRHVFETHACHLVVAEESDEIVGYAIYFFNFSTFRVRPGLYLEDIYVTPSKRGTGIGKELLSHLIAKAQSMGCGRVEWSVLDWNQRAIDFYLKMGAEILHEWRICRIVL